MAVCRECPQQIVWAKTLAGRSMALNAFPGDHEPNIAAQTVAGRLVQARVITADRPAQLHERSYVAHWLTCPAAAEFRRNHSSSKTTTTKQPDVPALL